MNNIAEGFEKWTIKDKQKFFIISRWSCGEVRSMLYIAVALWYISEDCFESLYDSTISISKMLSALINKIKF